MAATVRKSDIDKAIANVCAKIIREPMLYFSEADVQQIIVQSLNELKALAVTVATSVTKGAGSDGKYRTTLVHREYGAGDSRRWDVVIFDPEDAKQTDSTNLMRNQKYLPVQFAFEIGTEKTSDAAAHLASDLAKLDASKVTDTGYIIHIFRDTTSGPTGTLTRQNTEDKIKRMFTDVFKSSAEKVPDRVRVLAILLRTGHNRTKMRGKCEIFDLKTREWKKININRPNDIREAALQQLR